MAEDNLGTKKDYGVNGKHTRLGQEFSMDEFKGFTLATLKSIDERMSRMDTYYAEAEKNCNKRIDVCVVKFEKKMDNCEESIGNIEKWKSNLEGKLAVIVVFFTTAVSVVMPFINSLMQKAGELL